MSSNAELLKKLKIKTGSVKRLQKDVTSYEAEAQQQKTKVEGMKNNNADPHDVKKQGEFLEESEAVVAQMKTRLSEAHTDLSEFIARIEKSGNTEVVSSEDFATAKQLL
ncbi:hypothetical protein PROFUN_02598 [Planoprotostelium fungivorum]|uniref:Tubulin-specific chaperone A n=1 Tax=Planoprotostelium fungivorum TaxID=1890364 RepID=A0A2P6MPF2_9EUKA|nr:hypothetical protein PROFUN_02598 [Planoprotostelium fungivorum]